MNSSSKQTLTFPLNGCVQQAQDITPLNYKASLTLDGGKSFLTNDMMLWCMKYLSYVITKIPDNHVTENAVHIIHCISIL